MFKLFNKTKQKWHQNMFQNVKLPSFKNIASQFIVKQLKCVSYIQLNKRIENKMHSKVSNY